MNRERNTQRAARYRWLGGLLVLPLATLTGCNVDSFFNPSITGYWEHTPTSMPILERIDVIEPADDRWGQTSEVTQQDLVPSDLTYRAAPGDIVSVSIFELLDAGNWSIVTRRIDAGGFLRVPELGDVPAAGLTAQEIEDNLVEILRQGYLTRPQVDIVIEQGGAFSYTVYGAVAGNGQYTLINPDLRILDAMASAGGLNPAIKNIFVIRQVALTEETQPIFRRERLPSTRPPEDAPAPIDIDDLIDQLDQPPGGGPSSGPQLGAFQDDPLVDIDEVIAQEQPIDIDSTRRGGTTGQGSTWMFVEERGEWIRVPAAQGAPGKPPTPPGDDDRLYVERIIKIPVSRLLRGESRFNIVVRPKDRIFVEPPPTGVVYIDGEIARPGTFNLPVGGITLSRLVAAAGGLGQVAIPERIDLIRMVGENREAAIRLNLGAIRQRTEPDVMLKPNDHIIVGTNWIATPLAVIRSGFRATYGFGFLLDRNFGTDVFGAPPSNFNN